MEKKKIKKKTKTKKVVPFRVILSEYGEVSQIHFRSRQETLLRLPFVSLKPAKSPSNTSTLSSERKIPNSPSHSLQKNLDRLKSLCWASPSKSSSFLKEISRSNTSESKALSRRPTFSSAKVLEIPSSPKFIKKTRFEIFDLETDLKSHHFNWSVKTTHGDLPFASECSQMVTIGTSLFLCGGQNGGTLEVRALDLPTCRWSSLKPLKRLSSKFGYSLTSFKSKLLIYGGYLVDSTSRRHFSKKLIFLSINSGKVHFHKGYGSIPKARRNHSAAQLGSFFLIFGGILENNLQVSDLYTLNSLTFHWDKLEAANSPSSRSHGSLSAIFSEFSPSRQDFDRLHEVVSKVSSKNGGFFHFGGLDSSGKCLDELWCLRLISGRFAWSRVEPRGEPPQARYAHASATAGHKLFIFGGRNKEDSAIDDLSVFDSLLVIWERIQIHGIRPQPRWGHCMSFQNQEIFLFGGINHKGLLPAELISFKDLNEECFN